MFGKICNNGEKTRGYLRGSSGDIFHKVRMEFVVFQFEVLHLPPSFLVRW